MKYFLLPSQKVQNAPPGLKDKWYNACYCKPHANHYRLNVTFKHFEIIIMSMIIFTFGQVKTV